MISNLKFLSKFIDFGIRLDYSTRKNGAIRLVNIISAVSIIILLFYVIAGVFNSNYVTVISNTIGMFLFIVPILFNYLKKEDVAAFLFNLILIFGLVAGQIIFGDEHLKFAVIIPISLTFIFFPIERNLKFYFSLAISFAYAFIAELLIYINIMPISSNQFEGLLSEKIYDSLLYFSLLTVHTLMVYKFNKDLNENEEKLEESNRTKEKFLKIIAHDLKSPFSAILGLTGLLQEKHKSFDDDKCDELINAIHTSTRTTYKLLENLLVWSSLQADKIEYVEQKIDLKEILSETVLNLYDLADKKNIKISITINDNEIIFADRNMTSAILRNLISNAIKFTNKGGIIAISSKKMVDDGLLQVSVTDNGIGIPTNQIDNLFHIGMNTSMKGTENEYGTGLGLIICKDFVEKQGGKLWAKSEPNKGTIFNFTVKV